MHPRRSSHGRRLAVLLAALLAAAAVPMAAPAAPGGAAAKPSKPAKPASVVVKFDPGSAGRPVPRDFLGLSFEANRLPMIASWADRGNFVAMLRSLGPGVIRFGGASVDSRTAWSDDGSRPRWASTVITGPDLDNLGRLARASGWRVLLAVNLQHYDPQAAAREVAAARAAVGDRLAGVEIGNEPNAYVNHRVRPANWDFDSYLREFDAYRDAIRAAAPGTPIAGPSTSTGNVDWVTRFGAERRPLWLTAHYYTLSCHDAPLRATDLLRLWARKKVGRTFRRLLPIAHANHVPLRIDEANTVSCGGVAGVSNTFASALWTLDFAGQAMTHALGGLNLHGHPTNCSGYSPVCGPTPEDLEAGTLRAKPQWYGLLMTSQLIGDRPLSSSFYPRDANSSVTALAAPGGRIHLMLVNEGLPKPHPQRIVLRAPRRFGGGTILRLSAPSADATGRVELAGRRVQPDGTWTAPAKLPRLKGTAGHLSLTLPSRSAALVTLVPRPAGGKKG